MGILSKFKKANNKEESSSTVNNVGNTEEIKKK